MRTHVLLSIVLVLALITSNLLAPIPTYAGTDLPMASHSDETPALDSPLDLAHQHLVEVMDQYHQAFDVYTDVGAAGNHFVHRAMTGSDVTIDDTYTGAVHTGASAIRNTFTALGSNWGGWFFQNGVLLDEDTQPRDNFGDYPDAGFDLSGATHLTFWARGQAGGERVEFFAFGLGRNGAIPFKPYPDSSPKVTICGLLVSPCYVTLTTSWQRYTINLTGRDLHYVIGGFGWVTNAPMNSNQSITFYLDDIQYDKPRPDDLRLLVSYQTIPSGLDFDLQQRNVAYVYDNAMALNAFLAAGDGDRARMLADALVYAQDHDRWYTDGRLRDGYQGGDLISPPGWTPHGRVGTARMCGWWQAPDHWVENAECVGSHMGNLAWAMIALLNYYEQYGGSQYLTTALELGEWIEANTVDLRGAGGYTGGYSGWEPIPQKEMWKSTEHNLDLFVAFSRLHELTGHEVWQTRAHHARAFVEAMWQPGAPGHFWTGTLDDGITVNPQAIPLDAQSWSVLALGVDEQTSQAIAYAGAHHQATWGSYDGFDFNEDRDMPWPEGTGQMVVAYRLLGDDANAHYFLEELREIQATANNGNGKGVVAAPADGLTTGFGWAYFNRLHVGATAWFIAAEHAYNPYFANIVEVTMSLAAGWNLVTMPARPYPSLTAESLLQAIAAQGGTCTEIDQWRNGGWDAHIGGLPFGNFPIEMGKGYFLRCNGSLAFRLRGFELTSGVPLVLQPGWSLVGIPYPPYGYTAQSLLLAIAAQGGACGELDNWVSGGWSAYILGLPFGNITIAPDKGYFPRCSQASLFVPGAP